MKKFLLITVLIIGIMGFCACERLKKSRGETQAIQDLGTINKTKQLPCIAGYAKCTKVKPSEPGIYAYVRVQKDGRNVTSFFDIVTYHNIPVVMLEPGKFTPIENFDQPNAYWSVKPIVIDVQKPKPKPQPIKPEIETDAEFETERQGR